MNPVSEPQTIKARAPGKLILTGEHAVVYGNPAIATAIDKYVITSLLPDSKDISFNCPQIDYAAKLTLPELRQLKLRIQEQYAEFLHGNCTLATVIQHPMELLQYTCIHIIDKFAPKFSDGFSLDLDAEVPIGCGMGSSAAAIVSTLLALNELLDLNMNRENYLQLGQEIENLQHGKSSGLDIAMSLTGGCIRYENNNFTNKNMPQMPWHIINTGRPKISTGECVTAATKYFKQTAMLQDFADVTNAFDAALATNDLAELQRCISANHDLLVYIGAVPEKVQDFIAILAKQNIAAKICGAGACAGDTAGAILILPTDDIDTAIVKQYGYNMFQLQGDENGAKII